MDDYFYYSVKSLRGGFGFDFPKKKIKTKPVLKGIMPQNRNRPVDNLWITFCKKRYLVYNLSMWIGTYIYLLSVIGDYSVICIKDTDYLIKNSELESIKTLVI